MGNVRRGNLYPLCVGAERLVQAHVGPARDDVGRRTLSTQPRV